MELPVFLLGVVVVLLLLAYRNGSFRRPDPGDTRRAWWSSRAHGDMRHGHGFDYENDRFRNGGRGR